MVNGNRSIADESTRFQKQLKGVRLEGSSRFKHILVPTSLALTDRSALRLGAEMAVAYQATLTVLHVLPNPVDETSAHWLDAIDRLYRSLDHGTDGPSSSDTFGSVEVAQRKVRRFIEREFRQHLHDVARLRIECRMGDVAATVAEFAVEVAVDVVIMSSPLPRWWLPLLPSQVRRVMQLIRQPVILVTPEEAPGDAVRL